jgi:hypothetical protein
MSTSSASDPYEGTASNNHLGAADASALSKEMTLELHSGSISSQNST